ncbi:MAG: hypothetical protein ACXW3P_11330, partial [Rhodospirillales bacterium]
MRQMHPGISFKAAGAAFAVFTATVTATASAAAAERVISTQTGRVKVESVVRGLEHPWGLTFLP